MKSLTLSFKELTETFTVISNPELSMIIGGVEKATQYEYAYDPMGNVYWRVAGDDTWVSFTVLEPVTIYGTKPNSFSMEGAHPIPVYTGGINTGGGDGPVGGGGVIHGTNPNREPGFGFPPADTVLTEALSIGEIVALTINTNLAFQEFGMTLDAA